MADIRIATCQFEVTADVSRNMRWIRKFLTKAARAGADIVHFSECALCGYAGANHPSLEGFDWHKLRHATGDIMALAAELKLWVVLPSMHELTPPNRPHNCAYLIDPNGVIVNRYDKRFCTGGDLDHYTPGERFVVFNCKGVQCSLLICFDLRFPELYRKLCGMGVECIFQSFYNAGSGLTIHTHIMRQTMQSHAASNHFWMSMANTSGPRSPYASCFIEPDGKIVNQLKLNKPGMMINVVDTTRNFYDPSAPFRAAALAGALSNGRTPITDVRSRQTDSL